MKIKIALIGLLMTASVSMNVKAADDLANVEAMFIYNFLRHISWPDATNGNNFVIGVYGSSEIYNQLITYTNNRKIGTKSIQVKTISSPADAKACQLVFVPNSQSSKIAAIKAQMGNYPCLLIGEKEGSNAAGTTIEFLIQDNKLKFRVNEDRAKEQNLVLSRSLLDMAF
jgi:hypothetical protein